MEIREEYHGDVNVVTIDDHLDTTTAPQLEQKLTQLIETGARQFVIDCAPLQYVNSAGLKVFLIVAKQLDALGGQLVLCALAPNVQTIFQMIGFDRIMTITPTREEALRELEGVK